MREASLTFIKSQVESTSRKEPGEGQRGLEEAFDNGAEGTALLGFKHVP